jgi:TonB-dependent receptor
MFYLGVITVLAFAVVVAAGPRQAHAQATGAIAGQVVDEGGEPLPGANVLIVGINRGVATGPDGSFRIANVPAETHEVRVSFLGYESQSQTVTVPTGERLRFVLEPAPIQGEAVTVYGTLTRGQAKALNDQRNAVNVRTVVSTDKFSQYPDHNAAETVNRIAGVSVTRDQGEGEFVQIRSMSEQYNAQTINGQRMPAMGTGAGRSVGLDLIQSNLIERITVTKALTPDMDGDALGGAVDFALRQAGPEPEVILQLGGGYNNQESELPRDIQGRGIQNGFGLVSQRFLDGQLGVLVGGSYSNTDRGSLFNSRRYVAERGDERRRRRTTDYDLNRERYGLIGNLDYRFDAANELDLTFNLNRYRDDEIRRQARYDLEDGEEQRRTRNRVEDQQMSFAKLRGTHQIGSAELVYSGAWARAQEDLPDRTEFRFVRDNPQLLGLTPAEQGALNTRSTFEGLPPLTIDRAEYSPRYTAERSLTGTVDLAIPLNTGRSATVKVGGKVERRDRDFEEWEVTGRPTGTTPNVTVGGGDFPFPDVRFGDTQLADLNLSPALDSGDPATSAATYEAQETIVAGYAMNTTTWNDHLETLVGLRVEATQHDYLHVASGREGDGRYVTLLPSAHLTYRFTPNTLLRAAVSRGLSRPNYGNLVPFRSVDAGDQEIQQGNPDLEPAIAQNLDLMFEHYTSGLGFFSAGLFAKFFRDPVVTQGTTELIDGEEFVVFQPVNGGGADLYGLELATTQSLAPLGVRALRWFGVDANYTYTYSRADFGDERDDFPLVKSPEHVANVALTYDNSDLGLSAVIAGAYRSYLFEKFEGGLPIWEGSQFHLDASISYAFTERVATFLELNNLTNQPNEEIEFEPSRSISRLHEDEFYSWWGTLGVRLEL